MAGSVAICYVVALTWRIRVKRNNSILLVDDSRLNRLTLSDILREGYQIIEAENGKIALEILAERRSEIAVVILDLVMPVMDGFGVMEEVAKHPEYKYIPIIVATTDDDVENERRCLELGAWDFIPKSFRPEIIRFRVMNAISKNKMRLLEYDMLTGIYNQQRFYQATRDMLDETNDQKFAFIHFDIECFKMINAFYGVKTGDKLICYVASQIHDIMKDREGTFGRINGDIFCICIPFESVQEIADILEELKMRVREYAADIYHINTAAGIYIIEDNDMDVSVIYDKSCIAAKQCKGHYMVSQALYTKEMGEKLEREQRIVSEMDRALEQEEFLIYFQPKYELKEYRPNGAEALVRWRKPDGTLISPGEFIPVFEQNGFITKLDYYVWEKVCQFIRQELDEGREPEPISVNVSRMNLYQPHFLESISNLIKKYNVSPKYLYLELTESMFSDSAHVIYDSVANLHEMGFTILMDDFGSGYSSLNVLKDVDLDVLKLDMKFFSKGSSLKGEKIVESVIRMADSLKMPVIAEGVEEKHQVEMLSMLGCNFIQGYYFAKPMPMDAYRRLVRGLPEKEKEN